MNAPPIVLKPSAGVRATAAASALIAALLAVSSIDALAEHIVLGHVADRMTYAIEATHCGAEHPDS